MEKKVDPWKEIQSLITREKEEALRDYRRSGFVPILSESERSPSPARSWRHLIRLPSVAVPSAALLLLAAMGAVIWISRGNEGRLQTDRLSALLKDSILYRGGEPSTPSIETPGTAESALTPVLAALAGQSGLTRMRVRETVDSTATVERADPGSVRLKIERMIQGNTLEQMITRMAHAT